MLQALSSAVICVCTFVTRCPACVPASLAALQVLQKLLYGAPLDEQVEGPGEAETREAPGGAKVQHQGGGGVHGQGSTEEREGEREPAEQQSSSLGDKRG